MPFETAGASSSHSVQSPQPSTRDDVHQAVQAPLPSLSEQVIAIQRKLGHSLIVTVDGEALDDADVPDQGDHTMLAFHKHRGLYLLSVSLRRGENLLTVNPVPVDQIDLYQAALTARSAELTGSTRVPLPAPTTVEMFKACCCADESRHEAARLEEDHVIALDNPEFVLRSRFPPGLGESKIGHARRLWHEIHPQLSYQAIARLSGATVQEMRQDPAFSEKTTEIRELSLQYPKRPEESNVAYAKWLLALKDPLLTPQAVSQLSGKSLYVLKRAGVFGPYSTQPRRTAAPYPKSIATHESAKTDRKVQPSMPPPPFTSPRARQPDSGSLHKTATVVPPKLVELERMFKQDENIRELITVQEANWKCTGRQPVDKSRQQIQTALERQPTGKRVSDALAELDLGLRLAKKHLKQSPSAMVADLGWQTSYGSLVYLRRKEIEVLSVVEVPHPSFSAITLFIEHLQKQYGSRPIVAHAEASAYTKELLNAQGLAPPSKSRADLSLPQDMEVPMSPFSPQAMTPVPMSDLRKQEAWGMEEVQTVLRLIPAVLPAVTSLPVYWGGEGMSTLLNRAVGQGAMELKFSGNLVLHREGAEALALSCSARNLAYALSVVLGREHWRALCMELTRLAPHAQPQQGDYGTLLAEGCASFIEQNAARAAEFLKRALPYAP